MRTYHFVITLSWTLAPGAEYRQTTTGEMDIPEGFTRSQAYEHAIRTATDAAPSNVHRANPNTLFFSLEPDAL